MPGWHEKTKHLQNAGKLQVVGIIQEQHPARCQLFQQWKQMGWPVLVDSLNLLGVSGVPKALLIDEHGVIRNARPRSKDVEKFIATDFEKPEGLPAPASAPDIDALGKKMAGRKKAAYWISYADAAFLSGEERRLDLVVDAYRRASQLDDAPEIVFRLGVALRRRYESSKSRPTDFRDAVESWGRALAKRPGQYIWRRRIQQYGPRLEKPYAFYDWVPKAREDITARGQKPSPLAVEPGGAEFAKPSKTFVVTATEQKEPDPSDALPKDITKLVRASVAVAPPRIAPGKSARIHVHLTPDAKKKAHWNNEAGPVVLWVRPPKGVEVSQQWQSVPNAKKPESHERRELELEVRVAKDAKPGALKIPAYVTYFVCEGVNGVCFYYRQDVEVTLTIGN